MKLQNTLKLLLLVLFSTTQLTAIQFAYLGMQKYKSVWSTNAGKTLYTDYCEPLYNNLVLTYFYKDSNGKLQSKPSITLTPGSYQEIDSPYSVETPEYIEIHSDKVDAQGNTLQFTFPSNTLKDYLTGFWVIADCQRDISTYPHTTRYQMLWVSSPKPPNNPLENLNYLLDNSSITCNPQGVTGACYCYLNLPGDFSKNGITQTHDCWRAHDNPTTTK